MNSDSNPARSVAQLSLFGASSLPAELADAGKAADREKENPQKKRLAIRRTMDNPYLLAARRLAKQIRRLPERSPEETQAGLAICRALKAYLEDRPERTH